MLMRRIVDLSVLLRAGIASDPPGHLPLTCVSMS
jgi:hypothetical protein